MPYKCLDGEALQGPPGRGCGDKPTADVKSSSLDGPLVVVCSTDAPLCRVNNDVVDVDLQSVVATEF